MPNKTQEIQNLIDSNDVVLFIKGTGQVPMCGFSAAVVQIFNRLGVTYKDINVLADEELRSELKIFSEWPTLPQVYVKGEFIGGCDITKEMFTNGELQELLAEKNIASSPSAA